MAVFDVDDCFLNTPHALVIPVLQFWLVFQFRNRRGTRYFAISKDGKALNSVGRSCSLHFWEVSSVMVLAIAEWELSQNSLFEVVEERGQMIVLQQGKGHLSAALVELVALFREFTVQWPTCLLDKVSMLQRQLFRCPAVRGTNFGRECCCGVERAAFLCHSSLCQWIKQSDA